MPFRSRRPTKNFKPKRRVNTRFKRTLNKMVIDNKRSVVGDVVNFYPSLNYNCPLPVRYRTKLVASNYGVQNAGAGSGDNLFTILMNSPRLPFSVAVLTPGWTWLGPTVGTQFATGFSQLCNVNTYNRWRVYASAIEIDVMNQSVTDPCICSVTPSNTQNQPATLNTSLGAPYSKTLDFESGRSSNGNKTLKQYMSVHKFIGVSNRAIADDLSGQYYGSYNSQPVQLLYWIVNCETAANTALNAPLCIRFKLTYYIEFWDLVTASLPQL